MFKLLKAGRGVTDRAELQLLQAVRLAPKTGQLASV